MKKNPFIHLPSFPLLLKKKNTRKFYVQHAKKFIKFLNGIHWKYSQYLIFQSDETKLLNGKITSSLDMFLLNGDIVIILKVYLVETFKDFLDDTNAFNAVFGCKSTKEHTKLILLLL